MNKYEKQLITSIKEVLLATGFEHTYILEVSQDTNIIELVLLLPYHTERSHLEEVLNNLKEELEAHDVKITKQVGKKITIQFGKKDLSEIKFGKELIKMGTLQIELPSAFGSCTLDFNDGASCHLLNGGTTRMGKTSFLLYLCTCLTLQTEGKITLYITSTKAKDYYPFEGIATIDQSPEQFNNSLDVILTEYHYRNNLLYSPALAKATDHKSVMKLYPAYAKHFQPIFVIIDEYARFSENKEIQKKVQELVETAGFVNIHMIVSTQRPDARTVLPARIKANLLARICFTTTDKNNSIVILDQEGAENLGRIEGRAIFLDGETNIVQIPFIEPTECEEHLQPYKKERETNEKPANEKTEGSINNQLTNKIQNMFEKSIGLLSIPTEHEPHQHDKPSNETTLNGWFLLASKEGKR